MAVYNNVYRGVINVKQGTRMSAIYVNNNTDSFTVLMHMNHSSFRKWILCYYNKLMSCIEASVIYYLLNFNCLLMYGYLLSENKVMLCYVV